MLMTDNPPKSAEKINDIFFPSSFSTLPFQLHVPSLLLRKVVISGGSGSGAKAKERPPTIITMLARTVETPRSASTICDKDSRPATSRKFLPSIVLKTHIATDQRWL
jgi:hypothetical protein